MGRIPNQISGGFERQWSSDMTFPESTWGQRFKSWQENSRQTTSLSLERNLLRLPDSSRDKLTLRDQRYLPKIPHNLLFLRSVTSQPWYWYANINQHVILFTINDYFFINITTKSCSQHLEQRNRDQGKVIYSRRHWATLSVRKLLQTGAPFSIL